MKNFYLLLCFLATTTFSYAQELTPDMLVGEYEGTAEILFAKSSSAETGLRVKVIIEKNESDTLVLKLFYDGTKRIETNLLIEGDKIIAKSQEKEDIGIAIKLTTIKNYSGEKITGLNYGSFKNNNLKISICEKIELRGDINETNEELIYVDVKKQ